jgi:FKBP-type peptidyl-prolyl cis-trans isomerase 2
MRQGKHGDTVRVHYRGKLQDGSVFDASDRERLQFIIGGGQFIPGFEEAVVGMNPYFAEIYCSNSAFASRLHEKIKAVVGRSIREVGELDF